MSAPISAPSSSNPSSSGTPLTSSQLNMNDFLNLLTVQLENQNPLNPMSDSEFFAQMAQLGQVQGMDQLNKAADVQQAQALMGQVVTAVDTSAGGGGKQVTGIVANLSVQSGKYLIGLQQADGTITSVPMTSIESVKPPQNLDGATNLIGHTVSGAIPTTANGKATTTTIQGVVTGVSLVAGVPTLAVKDSTGNVNTIGLDQVTSVTN